MNIPKPRDVQEAMKQARVQDRANRLFADGYRAKYVPSEDVILVKSDEGNTYKVNTLFEQCTCPFYTENDYCKHAIGGQKLLADTLAEEQEIEEANACEMSVEAYRRFKDPFCEE